MLSGRTMQTRIADMTSPKQNPREKEGFKPKQQKSAWNMKCRGFWIPPRNMSQLQTRLEKMQANKRRMLDVYSRCFYLQMSRWQMSTPDSCTNSTESEQKGNLYSEIDLKICFISNSLQLDFILFYEMVWVL